MARLYRHKRKGYEIHYRLYYPDGTDKRKWRSYRTIARAHTALQDLEGLEHRLLKNVITREDLLYYLRCGYLSQDEAERIIPQAEVVAITGAAFTNHTIERLIKLCAPRAYVIVLGGTAPLSPVLFDYGINAISGTKVVNIDLALCCISQGATHQQIGGIRKITLMSDAKGAA